MGRTIQGVANFFSLSDADNHRGLRLTGRWMSIVFSIGYGLTVYSSLFDESFAEAAFVGFCVAGMNLFMSYKDAPEMMAEFFGCDNNIETDTDDIDIESDQEQADATAKLIPIPPQRFSSARKVLLVIGGLSALCTGIGAAALSYESIPSSLKRLGSDNEGVNYALTSLFALTIATCFISMLTRSYKILLKNNNLSGNSKEFVKDACCNFHGKNYIYEELSKIGFFFLVSTFITLGSAGLYFETYPGHPSTKHFIEKNFGTAEKVAGPVSFVYALIIPLIAQYPFTLRTLFMTAVSLKNQIISLVKIRPHRFLLSGRVQNLKHFLLYIIDQLPNLMYTVARCVNAHGNAKLAEEYAAENLGQFAYICSFLLSYSFPENTKPDLSLGILGMFSPANKGHNSGISNGATLEDQTEMTVLLNQG